MELIPGYNHGETPRLVAENEQIIMLERGKSHWG